MDTARALTYRQQRVILAAGLPFGSVLSETQGTKVNRLMIAALALVASANVAFATDLNRPSTYYPWTGPYIGAEFGSTTRDNTNARSNWSYVSPWGNYSGGESYDMSGRALVAGVRGGYLYQLTDWAVVGAELSALRTHLTSNVDITNCPGCGYSDVLHSKTDWAFAGQLMFGVAYRNWLPYGFVGVITAPIEVCEVFTSTWGSNSTQCNKYGSHGLTVGGGVTIQVAPRVNVDLRYRHAEFSALTQDYTDNGGYRSHQELTKRTDMVTIGLHVPLGAR
jgi:opacity protein-like surface antigen